jgi:hypothetical protein
MGIVCVSHISKCMLKCGDKLLDTQVGIYQEQNLNAFSSFERIKLDLSLTTKLAQDIGFTGWSTYALTCSLWPR